MRILFLGDIVGRPGRKAVVDAVPGLRSELALDFIVANAENAAGGAGITAAIARELLGCGIDALTLGDHTWDHHGFERDIDGLERVCRPANLPTSQPGRTSLILEHGGLRLAVATVLGRTFMGPRVDCPFLTADKLLAEMEDQADAALIEIHAEATSEKIAMGWYLDGRAAVVVGTHTHVATADATTLPRGTAYLTDAGMCGPHASVLGREIAPCIGRFVDGMPRRCPVAEGDVRINGLLVDFDEQAKACTSVQRFSR